MDEATTAMFMLDMTTHHSFSPDLHAALDSKAPPPRPGLGVSTAWKLGQGIG